MADHSVFIVSACLSILRLFMVESLFLVTLRVLTLESSLQWGSDLSLARRLLFFMSFGILICLLGFNLIHMAYLKEILVLLLVEEFSGIAMVIFLVVSANGLVIATLFLQNYLQLLLV